MTSALPSAEVAADFRDALQDLKINSRPEISNLTVIAKENTEHAQAISRELEDHIRKTRPEWKLPALYVLDSVVKNVGTPYTVYLGRNLYSVYFSAYTVVDANTRKAMDSLLRTWKQPVPESLDPRPVFDPEVTRNIENALSQFRTRVLQQQPQSQLDRRRSPGPQAGQWRSTSTPPPVGYPMPTQSIPHLAAPLANPPSIPSPLRQFATPVQDISQYGRVVSMQNLTPTPEPGLGSGPAPNLDKIRADLTQLIFSTSMELAKNPVNAAQTQELLKTLMDLQKILSAGNLHPQALQQVASEVHRISGMLQNSTVSSDSQQHAPQPLVSQPQQPPALAAILHSLNPVPSVSTPQPVAIAPVTSTPPVAPPADQISQLLASLQPRATPNPRQPPAITGVDLFASLRAAGLITGSAIATPPVAPDPTVRVKSPVNLLQSLTGPPLRMDTASLKVPRPYLVSRLYENKPDQCRQCGKRFAATDAGKKAKAAHMDWHFSINTRIAEASKGVVNRSWYISELEWIKYREGEQSSDGADNDSGATSANASPNKKRVEHVVPVPTDVSEVNKICPICQEKFDVTWHDELQTPVWSNAVRVVKKVYHKTCYDEVFQNKTPAPRRNSPSVLGKRKLEVGA